MLHNARYRAEASAIEVTVLPVPPLCVAIEMVVAGIVFTKH
jgi:hypothetical protein